MVLRQSEELQYPSPLTIYLFHPWETFMLLYLLSRVTRAFGYTSAARNDSTPPPAQKKKGGPSGQAAHKLTGNNGFSIPNNGFAFPLNLKHQSLA